MSQAPKAFIPITQSGQPLHPEYARFFEQLAAQITALQDQNAALTARVVLLEAEVFP